MPAGDLYRSSPDRFPGSGEAQWDQPNPVSPGYNPKSPQPWGSLNNVDPNTKWGQWLGRVNQWAPMSAEYEKNSYFDPKSPRDQYLGGDTLESMLSATDAWKYLSPFQIGYYKTQAPKAVADWQMRAGLSGQVTPQGGFGEALKAMITNPDIQHITRPSGYGQLDMGREQVTDLVNTIRAGLGEQGYAPNPRYGNGPLTADQTRAVAQAWTSDPGAITRLIGHNISGPFASYLADRLSSEQNRYRTSGTTMAPTDFLDRLTDVMRQAGYRI